MAEPGDSLKTGHEGRGCTEVHIPALLVASFIGFLACLKMLKIKWCCLVQHGLQWKINYAVLDLILVSILTLTSCKSGLLPYTREMWFLLSLTCFLSFTQSGAWRGDVEKSFMFYKATCCAWGKQHRATSWCERSWTRQLFGRDCCSSSMIWSTFELIGSDYQLMQISRSLLTLLKLPWFQWGFVHWLSQYLLDANIWWATIKKPLIATAEGTLMLVGYTSAFRKCSAKLERQGGWKNLRTCLQAPLIQCHFITLPELITVFSSCLGFLFTANLISLVRFYCSQPSCSFNIRWIM